MYVPLVCGHWWGQRSQRWWRVAVFVVVRVWVCGEEEGSTDEFDGWVIAIIIQ